MAVALTFDMGGRVDPALQIMGELIDLDVHATVFMTGAMADSVNTDVGRQVLSLVSAHPEQFALGNHSYTHTDFRTLTSAQIRDELARTEVAIAPRCSVSPRPLFRPPYGGWNAAVLAAVGSAGYAETVTWDIDTIDWKMEKDGGPTTADIVAKVVGDASRGLAGARGGSIVLMHLGGYNTAAAVPAIVSGLRARGFELVTIPELLAR